MRNERKTGLLLVLACCLGVLVPLASCGTGAGLDVETLPSNMRAPYRRFASRCSRCHSLSRPLSAPVNTVEHWERYLARMRRQPGSGINEQDSALILEFLTYYTMVVRGNGTQGDEATGSGDEVSSAGEGASAGGDPAGEGSSSTALETGDSEEGNDAQ